jgi:hypothetical protein
MSEISNLILERVQETEFGQVISGYEGEFIEFMKAFALDAIHDGSIQDLLFEDGSTLEEVILESEASKLQDIGKKYWNAYFIPELGIIVQVTATDEQDAEATKDKYVKQQLESK